MGLYLMDSDITAFIDSDTVDEMITDAEAIAILVAPCLATLNTAPDGETEAEEAVRTQKIAAVKAVLRGAIIRWEESRSKAVQQTAGPFGMTTETPQVRKSMFWPSEIEQLQSICANTVTGKAFAIDTVRPDSLHAPWCSLSFGAASCSCGANLAGFPILEP